MLPMLLLWAINYIQLLWAIKYPWPMGKIMKCSEKIDNFIYFIMTLKQKKWERVWDRDWEK